MAQINRDSFIVFHDGGGPEVLPRPFDVDNGFCSPAVVLVAGETYSQYINASVGGLTSIDDASGSYGITSSATSISTLSETHTILTFSLPSDLPEGSYVLKSGSLTSHPVAVMPTSIADKLSALVEYGSDRTVGNFYYPYAEEGYNNKIRIRLNARETQPFIEKDTYGRVSDGKIRTLQGKRILFTIFETPEYTNLMHAACDVMTLHDRIKINGIDYIFRPENAYSVQGDSGQPISNGEFGLVRNDSTILIRA